MERFGGTGQSARPYSLRVAVGIIVIIGFFGVIFIFFVVRYFSNKDIRAAAIFHWPAN